MEQRRTPAPRGVRSISIIVFLYLTVCSGAAPASVIIDEIMQNPAVVSDARGEWFELFNTGAAVVDLYHWRIADLGTDSHVVNAHVIVPVRGYAVLARAGSGSGNGGAAADYVYGGDIVLGNGADQLVLYDPAGTQIDRVAWDGGPGFPDPNGASMALLDPGLDNDVGGSWTVSTTPFGDGDLGTPGSANFASFSDPPPQAAVPAPAPWGLLVLPAGWLLLRSRAPQRA